MKFTAIAEALNIVSCFLLLRSRNRKLGLFNIKVVVITYPKRYV